MSNIKSEFEKLLKQHRDALTDELVKLGKHRQVQLVEWDIERNETDYEFYFDGAWQHQQTRVDELQKRLDAVQALAERWKAYKGLDIKQIGLQNCANELEQALKGGGE